MPKGLPYAGWYNGDFEMQKANGTYSDFRDMFVEKVKLHKMKQKELDQMDKEWEAIPLEDRQKRRQVVVEDSSLKEVQVMTHEGPIVMLKSAPDEGNNVKRMRDKIKQKKERRLAAGTLTNENNPLAVSIK